MSGIDVNGNIIAVGSDRKVVRNSEDGSLDTTFGGQGISYFSGTPRSVVIQDDGKIVVAGESENYFSTDFAVARYVTDIIPSTNVSLVGNDLVVQDTKGFANHFSLSVDAAGVITLADLSGAFIELDGVSGDGGSTVTIDPGQFSGDIIINGTGGIGITATQNIELYQGQSVTFDGSASFDLEQAVGSLIYEWDISCRLPTPFMIKSNLR